MDPDLALVLGLIVGALSVPSILSAIADGRAPRASALTILIAGGAVLYAIQTKAGGYTLEGIPEVVTGVIARYMP